MIKHFTAEAIDIYNKNHRAFILDGICCAMMVSSLFGFGALLACII
jgi:hypothetical protein